MRRRNRRKIALDNAYRRAILTPVGVEMIRITDRRGRTIECSDAKEAIAVLEHLEREEQKAIRRKEGLSIADIAVAAIGGKEETSPWTREGFWKFIDSLGSPQKRIVALLVEHRHMRDEELREAVKVSTNLELGGILSGISKQAAAHNVPARAVFTIQNESKGGEMTKTYAVALEFLRLATEMNWPTESD